MRWPERLPELSGRWLAAYKALWCTILAVSLVAMTAGRWAHSRSSPTLELACETLDALIVLTGAMLLFWRRPNDPVAALLSLGFLAVPADDIALMTANPTLQRWVGGGLAAVPMVCILLGLTLFPGGRFHPRWTLLIFPAMVCWAIMLFSAEMSMLGTLALVLPGMMVTIGSLAWRYRGMTPGIQRQQVKWVMLGFAGFFACGMIELALIYLDGTVSGRGVHYVIFVASNLIAPLEGACIVGGLLVSLLRYRLYDADAAISRSAVYAGLTITLFGVFAASETLIQAFSQKWLGAGTGAVGGALAAAFAASLLVPLHHRLNDWAKSRFQGDLTRLRARLPEVLIAIRDSSSPNELAQDALKLAMRGVHASSGAILLVDRGRLMLAHAEGLPGEGLAERLADELPAEPARGAMRSDDPELALRVPLIAPEGTAVGWLALGPHPDGSHYGKDDRRTLEELASPLARAFSLAIERFHREKEREAERRSLVERLAQLEQALAQVVSPPHEAGLA